MSLGDQLLFFTPSMSFTHTHTHTHTHTPPSTNLLPSLFLTTREQGNVELGRELMKTFQNQRETIQIRTSKKYVMS